MSNDSMWRYSQFATEDAVSLAEWLDTDFNLAAVRKAFEAMSPEERVRFECQNAEVIQEIIRRTEGQRPAYLKRLGKTSDETTCGLVIVFAMLALSHVRALIEIRDRFQSMRPGSGYRVACSTIYGNQDFYLGSLRGLSNYGWPHTIFSQYTGDHSWMDEDEDTEEDDDDSEPA